jgi:putative transposase
MSKQIMAGSRWLFNARIIEVDGPLTFNQVQVRDLGTGQLMAASMHELQPMPTEKVKEAPVAIAQAEWDRALPMAQAFAPFASSASLPGDAARALSKRFGISVRQILRYRAKYQSSPLTTSLARCPGGRPKGMHFIDTNAEQLTQHVIAKHYARREKASQVEVCERVRLMCNRLKWPPPDPKTVRARIRDAEGYELICKQRGARAARQMLEPRPGKLVVSEPLSLIEIDHTLVDLMLVDADDPSVVIGRPWLTLAIDVATRVVLGYYLSMDPPSVVSVAMCLAHVIQPKLENALDPDYWPMHGKPLCVLVDNGKDFRSHALQRGCEQHGIKLMWRPVREPHYGAHIERLMGTFMRMVHTLPGTTFSNSKARGDYPSERKACFTLEDFRAWLIEKICRTYHVSKHRGLGEPPTLAWERSFRTEDGTISLPPMPVGLDTLRMDFYPYKYRLIRRTGVQFNRSRYWNSALVPFIHPDRQLAVHYHPHDDSRVWVRTEDGNLIEAGVVAGQALGEGRQVVLSFDDAERLDAKKLSGYERADAIKGAAEARKRNKRPPFSKKSASVPKGKPSKAKPTAVSPIRPPVPLNRASVRAEVLDV